MCRCTTDYIKVPLALAPGFKTWTTAKSRAIKLTSLCIQKTSFLNDAIFYKLNVITAQFLICSIRNPAKNRNLMFTAAKW
jgi:hypothetical protein